MQMIGVEIGGRVMDNVSTFDDLITLMERRGGAPRRTSLTWTDLSDGPEAPSAMTSGDDQKRKGKKDGTR